MRDLTGSLYLNMLLMLVITSFVLAVTFLKLGIPESDALEMWLSYNAFIDANPEGVNYQLFVPFNNSHEVMIENGAYLFTKRSSYSNGNELDKRHKNCLNRNEKYKCHKEIQVEPGELVKLASHIFLILPFITDGFLVRTSLLIRELVEFAGSIKNTIP